MIGRAINYEQASSYYEHSADYYSCRLTNYDRWHGKLAKRLKLSGEVSKGEFEAFCQNMDEEERRKRILLRLRRSDSVDDTAGLCGEQRTVSCAGEKIPRGTAVLPQVEIFGGASAKYLADRRAATAENSTGKSEEGKQAELSCHSSSYQMGCRA